MRTFFCFFLCLIAVKGSSQEYKDTTLLIRGTPCSCKYNLKTEDDLGVSLSGGHGTKSTAEQPAHYSAGKDDWEKFLKKNLDKGLKGKHEVEIRFRVNKNGDLSDFELLSASPAQKFQEVVRVLRLSGKWFPAIRNGYCIGSAVRLVFEL